MKHFLARFLSTYGKPKSGNTSGPAANRRKGSSRADYSILSQEEAAATIPVIDSSDQEVDNAELEYLTTSHQMIIKRGTYNMRQEFENSYEVRKQ